MQCHLCGIACRYVAYETAKVKGGAVPKQESSLFRQSTPQGITELKLLSVDVVFCVGGPLEAVTKSLPCRFE